MKCYIYARVSGKSQIDGDGFDRQSAATQAWAAVHGVEVVQEFREEGVTGEADWSNRPAFVQMMSQVLGNGTKTILVENLTRLARSFTVQETILTYLASKGVSLISVDTGEDVIEAINGDPMRRAIVQVQSVFAELEKRTLVNKLRAARERKKAETGRCGGRTPFGEKPGEKEILNRIRHLKRTGRTYVWIARKFNEEGVPTRTGVPWQANSMRKIAKRRRSRQTQPSES